MRTKMRKPIAVLLSVLMVVCFLPATVLTANAANYTLTFNPNGGTCGTTSVPVTTGSANYYEITWNIPTKSGATFLGWFDAGGTQVYGSNGYCTNGTGYWSGNTWVYNGNVTVYAHWSYYTISFNNNGGTGGVTSVQVNPGSDAYYETSWGKPTKSGATFAGWFDTSGVQVYDADGYCVRNTKYWDGNAHWIWHGDISVVAHWSNYTMTLNPNGGTIDINRLTMQPGTADYYKLEGNRLMPVRAGYSFTGWYDSNGTQVYGSDNRCINGTIYWNNSTQWIYHADVTFYAHWSPANYSVTYNANGGTVSPASVNYNIEGTGTLAEPSRAHYSFSGWKPAADSGSWSAGTIYPQNTSLNGKYGDVTLVAQWSPDPYTLTLNANGGTVAASSIPYNVESTDTLPLPTRAGYDFAGWKVTTAAGSWISDAEFAAGSSLNGKYGDATLTAQWTVCHDTAYTINSYYMNADGTYPDTPVTQTFFGTTEDTVAATNAAGAPANYTLDAAASDESVEILGDGSAVLNLYYKLDEYTVTFSIDGTETSADYCYGAVPAYDGETPTLDATDEFTYTFLGWTADASAEPGSDAAYYAANALPAVTGDVTYYPYFGAAVNSYDITFTVDGTDTVVSFPYGSTPAYDGIPAKEADAQYTYAFTGWDPEISAVSGEATYTAQFDSTLRQYPVFVNGGVGSEISLSSGMRDWGTVLEFTVTVDEAYSDSEPTVTVGEAILEGVKSGNVFSYSTTVTGNTEIGVSDLTKNTYTITFTVDGTGIETTVAYGETPAYDGIPSKAADDENYYVFTGWDPEIVPATEDAEYTAQFDTIPFPAHEHDFATFVRTVAATCVAGGYDEYVCECGMTEQRDPTAVNAANHATSAITVGAREATETEDGYSGDLICPACGVTITEGSVIPKTGSETPAPHEHDFAYVRTVAATCCEKGYDEYACACGMTEKRNETADVDEDNHAGTMLTVGAREATEEADGYTGDTVCSACGKTLTTGTVIPKTGSETPAPHTHTFDTFVAHHDATCCEKGYDEYKCDCGMTEKRNETAAVDADNHVGTVLTVGAREATETADGYTGDTVCSACGKTVKRGSVIPKTGTEPTDPTEPEEPIEPGEPTVYEHGCPYCGKTHDGTFVDRLIGLIHTFLHVIRTLFKVVPKS